MSEQSLVERAKQAMQAIERCGYNAHDTNRAKEALAALAQLEAQLSNSEPVPAAWDEWALDRSREMVRQMEEVPHPRAQLVARLHCLLVEAMEFAAHPVSSQDAAPLNEDELWDLRDAICDKLERKAAPHAWVSFVAEAVSDFITKRRAAMTPEGKAE